MTPNRYFHIRGGREAGPFTAIQLQQIARRGGISPDDLIRPEDSQKSYPARNVVGLFPGGGAGSAKPGESAARPAAFAPVARSGGAPQATQAAANPPRSPLQQLLAALVDLQREELTKQVARGERTAADAERRSGELAALLRAVEVQFAGMTNAPSGFLPAQAAARTIEGGGERIQQTAAATSPYMPSPPAADSGLGTVLGIGAAALVAGGAGMALGRAMAPSPTLAPTLAPTPTPPPPSSPPRESAGLPSGLAQVSRSLWSTRPIDTGSHFPGDAGSHEPPHLDSTPQDISFHDLPHTPDPIHDAEIIEPAAPSFDSSPSSGLNWDDPASSESFASYTPPDDIPMAEPLEQNTGSFFGNFFGNDSEEVDVTDVEGTAESGWFGDATESTTETAAADGGWFGGSEDAVADAGGLLDGGLDTGDVDLGGLDFGDGGGFEF